LLVSHHHSSYQVRQIERDSLRQQKKKKKKNNNKEKTTSTTKKEKGKEKFFVLVFFFVQRDFVMGFYISAFIRSDEEIVEGRILTLGVTKSPSLALPDGECDDGGTTAAVG
jgi:hypothetical protein